MKKWLVLLFLLLLVLSGCEQKIIDKPDTFLKSLKVTINQKKFADHPMWRDYTVIITDQKGKLVDVDKITLKMDMRTMSHPVEDQLERVSVGKYHVRNKEILMAGRWYSEFKLYHDQHVLKIVKD
jgi:hypothetical protein